MPPRNATLPVSTPPEVETLATIEITKAQRESIDNDVFILRAALHGAIARALYDAPKGCDLVVTIARR